MSIAGGKSNLSAISVEPACSLLGPSFLSSCKHYSINGEDYSEFYMGRPSGKNEIPSKLSYIFVLKSMGGWGLLNFWFFEKALSCKSLWRGIFGEGSWSTTIQKKYMGRKDFSLWFREGRICPSYGSPIWLSLHKVERYFLGNLTCRFQTGNKILIGIDQFLSGDKVINV